MTPDLDALREALNLAFDRWLDDDGSVDDLVAARDAYRRAQRPPVPTEAGSFYLASGEPAPFDSSDGTVWVNSSLRWRLADRLTWATHPTTGELVPVPGLGEWLEVLGDVAIAEAERDDARAERDEWAAKATALLVERYELLARIDDLEAPGECQSLHKLRARVAELEAERDALQEAARQTVACRDKVLRQVQDERDELRAQLERAKGLAIQLVGDMADDHDPSVQEYARALSDVIDALEPPKPPQRCVDCVHCTTPYGCEVSAEEESIGEAGPTGEWIDDHWHDNDAPQPIPCPGFAPKEADHVE